LRAPARAAAVAVLALMVAAIYSLSTSVSFTAQRSAAPRAPTPLRDAAAISAHPRRYRWVRVGIAGHVGARPRGLPKHLRNSFVLKGFGDARLLVVPPTGGRLDRQRVGAWVAVRGRVVPVSRIKRRAKHGTLTRAELAERAGATAVVKAVSVRPGP
jgi:hypothetical protein